MLSPVPGLDAIDNCDLCLHSSIHGFRHPKDPHSKSTNQLFSLNRNYHQQHTLFGSHRDTADS